MNTPNTHRVTPGTISLRASSLNGPARNVPAQKMSSGTVDVNSILRRSQAAEPAAQSSVQAAMHKAASALVGKVNPEPEAIDFLAEGVDDSFTQELDKSLDAMFPTAPALVQETDLSQALSSALQGEVPVQDLSDQPDPEQNQQEEESFNLPQVLELSRDNDGSTRVVISLMHQKCITCVEFNPGAVDGIDLSAKCSHRLCGNTLCPAQNMTLQATGKVKVMVRKLEAARKSNDMAEFCQVMSKLNAEDINFQQEVYRRLGMFSS